MTTEAALSTQSTNRCFVVGALFIRSMGLDDLEESKRNAVLKLLDMSVDVELYHRVEITLNPVWPHEKGC